MPLVSAPWTVVRAESQHEPVPRTSSAACDLRFDPITVNRFFRSSSDRPASEGAIARGRAAFSQATAPSMRYKRTPSGRVLQTAYLPSVHVHEVHVVVRMFGARAQRPHLTSRRRCSARIGHAGRAAASVHVGRRCLAPSSLPAGSAR